MIKGDFTTIRSFYRDVREEGQSMGSELMVEIRLLDVSLHRLSIERRLDFLLYELRDELKRGTNIVFMEF